MSTTRGVRAGNLRAMHNFALALAAAAVFAAPAVATQSSPDDNTERLSQVNKAKQSEGKQ